VTAASTRTEKEAAIDRLLLLYLIDASGEPVKDEETLQMLVFLAQRAGAPFSYSDWIWLSEEEEENRRLFKALPGARVFA